MKTLEGLCAIMRFSLTLSLFLLQPERHTEIASSYGIQLKPATLLTVGVQGMALGAIIGIHALLKRSAPIQG